MREAGKRIKKIILTFAAAGSIAIVLLLSVYLLPTDRMINNARASIPLFEELGLNRPVIQGYKATTLDTYTDAWMMRIAFYNGEESVLQKSMSNYYYGYDNESTGNVCESMIAYLNGMEGYRRLSYGKYWHGYLAVLKPLLYFFDYGDIMEILKFVQLALVAFCIVLLERAKLTRCIPAMIVMLGCVEFHVIGMSMQFSWVFMIALVSSVFLLKKKEEAVCDSSIEFVFLITGICTSFFDFLTFPIFALGVPLTIITLRRSVTEKTGRLFILTLSDSFYWMMGYGGMWVLKWILGIFFTGENLIAEAVYSIKERTISNTMGLKIGFLEAIKENLWTLGKYPYVLAVMCAVVFLMLGKGHLARISKEMAASYLFVICLPFVWYIISRNHAYIHAFMAYRNLGISVFAGLCFLSQIKKVNIE